MHLKGIRNELFYFLEGLFDSCVKASLKIENSGTSYKPILVFCGRNGRPGPEHKSGARQQWIKFRVLVCLEQSQQDLLMN